jgi:hypothetical protein
MAVTALEIKSCSPLRQGKPLAMLAPTSNWMARAARAGGRGAEAPRAAEKAV